MVLLIVLVSIVLRYVANLWSCLLFVVFLIILWYIGWFMLIVLVSSRTWIILWTQFSTASSTVTEGVDNSGVISEFLSSQQVTYHFIQFYHHDYKCAIHCVITWRRTGLAHWLFMYRSCSTLSCWLSVKSLVCSAAKPQVLHHMSSIFFVIPNMLFTLMLKRVHCWFLFRWFGRSTVM